MEYIYHYTTYNALLKILENMSLRFSSLDNTNDPKEYLSHTLLYENFSQDKEFSYYDNLVKEEINKYKIICFSVDAEIPGYAHPRMWAQYAQNHEGCCLVLNKAIIESSIEKLYNNGIEFIGCLVKYVPEILEKKYNLQDNLKIFIRKNIDYFLFTKFIDWQNEHEFRYITYEPKELYLDIRNSIKGIYFGHRFPLILKEKVMELFYDDKEFVEVSWKNGICHKNKIFKSYKDYLVKNLRENFNKNLLSLNKICPDFPFNGDSDKLLRMLYDNNSVNKVEYDKLKKYKNELYFDLSNRTTDNIKHLLKRTNDYFDIIKNNREM